MESASALPGEPLLVCLGEALVDLICPDPLSDPADARRFEVHFGGALANVAVAARRAGCRVGLAGGCGDDRWGAYLRRRLTEEGVDLSFGGIVEGVPTPFAFATLDEDREPSFDVHGDGIDAAIATLEGRERELVDAAGGVAFGSNTLLDAASRSVTERVRDGARAAGVPLLFDPNLRPGRWRDRDRARELCLASARVATVVKCNLDEARWLIGDEAAGVARAAEELLSLGPELAVVTAGADAIAARGACRVDLSPPPVDVVSPLGSGDVFMGTLAAGLLAGGWELSRAEGAIERAAVAGADACTRLGAF
ncbi:MAG: carbohydrate kinase, partial [Solirubrobacterales bacterium]|nr:carbohydrate kinase [Solirubrobacterales bacterium]